MRPLRLILLYSVLASACASHVGGARPPGDPLEQVTGDALFHKGLAYARAGDLTRAEQYVHAAELKGFDRRKTVRALVKICVAASRLRVAASYLESYLADEPDDASLHYIGGTIYAGLKDREMARRHFVRALNARRKPVEEAALGLVGLLDDPDRKREMLARYLERSPNGTLAPRAREMFNELEMPSSDHLEGLSTAEDQP